jgi:hypothetical protein
MIHCQKEKNKQLNHEKAMSWKNVWDGIELMNLEWTLAFQYLIN